MNTRVNVRGTSIARLLFVADAAVADADELPSAVRALIDAAAEVYVVTPTLPGRLAWLADDIDGLRHLADERLDEIDHRRSSVRDRRGINTSSSYVARSASAWAHRAVSSARPAGSLPPT